MFEVAGGIALLIIGWFCLQAAFVFVLFIFSSINDWYYSHQRWKGPSQK